MIPLNLEPLNLVYKVDKKKNNKNLLKVPAIKK